MGIHQTIFINVKTHLTDLLNGFFRYVLDGIKL